MPFHNFKNEISRSRRIENTTNKNGLRHKIVSVIGDVYIGCWKDNKKEGKGACFTKTKTRTDGDWLKGYRDGFAVLSHLMENGVYVLDYRGFWKRDHFSGYGARHYEDGSYYRGYWKKSRRHGYGQMWYANGDYYDGDWVGDKREGIGLFVLVNANRYEGSWLNDMKEGKGIFYFLDTGQMQVGVWRQDVCITSCMTDILFRHTAVNPTPQAIPYVELVDADNVYEEQETKALSYKRKSCLALSNFSIPSKRITAEHDEK